VQVVERLQAWQAALSSPCQVVLLPAVRDAFHHPTFPQPAIDLQAQDQVRPAADKFAHSALLRVHMQCTH
jgi:hypothetical protein